MNKSNDLVPTAEELTARLEIASANLNAEVKMFSETTVLGNTGKTISAVINAETLAAGLNAVASVNYHHHYDSDGDDDANPLLWAGIIAASFTGLTVLCHKIRGNKRHKALVAKLKKIKEVESLLGVQPREAVLQEILQNEETAAFDEKLQAGNTSPIQKQEELAHYVQVFDPPSAQDLYWAEEILAELEENFVKIGIVPKQQWI